MYSKHFEIKKVKEIFKSFLILSLGRIYNMYNFVSITEESCTEKILKTYK